MSSFDRSKPPKEVSLREAHEKAVQRSLAVYNANAVGVGSMRKKYEELLQKFFRKAFEDYKRNVFIEADLQRSTTIQSMEKRLRVACHASDASIDNVVKVPDALLSKYEASCHGLGKWRKLAVFFLQQSLEKAANVQERTSMETQLRENTLREEFSRTLAEKEVEIKDKSTKVEHAKQCLMTLELELKVVESKIEL